MSERRLNPLTGDWVLVSANRTARPWQGSVEQTPTRALQAYDPECYLCPRNARAHGDRNPDYASTFVFDNDFAALTSLQAQKANERSDDGILVSREESGICRVVCFSPRHDLSLPEMNAQARRAVVDAWAEEYQHLGSRDDVSYVQIFENRGAMMGASNPHPHGQIWASSSIPNEPAKEQAALRQYQHDHGTCLLCSYIAKEIASGERLVYANDGFAVIVPFWANWPFEAIVVSRTHVGDSAALGSAGRDGLGDAIAELGRRYDELFNVPFPYSMGFHQRPTDGEAHDECHLHAHYYPPLLRSATVRKFAVGYEMLAQPQRDLTAEEAAARLRGETSSL